MANSHVFGKDAFQTAGSRMVRELEHAYYDCMLRNPDFQEAVIVTYKSLSPRGGLYGQYKHTRWQVGGHETPQILIAAEILGDPEAVLDTLLHEGSHGVAIQRGIQDNPRGYHNQEFLALAEEAGLQWPADKTPDPKLGFSWVELRPETKRLYTDTLVRLGQNLKGFSPHSNNMVVETTPERQPRSAKLYCHCRPKPRTVTAAWKVASEGEVYCGFCRYAFEFLTPEEIEQRTAAEDWDHPFKEYMS